MDWDSFLLEISTGIRGLDWLSNQKLSVQDQLRPSERKVLKAMLPTPNSLLSIKEMKVELGTEENTINSQRKTIISRLKVKNAIELQINLANQFKSLGLDQLDLSPGSLWRELLKKSEYTDNKIKIIPISDNEIKPAGRGTRRIEQEQILVKINIDCAFFIHIYPEKQGDLILFERSGTGEVYCLSSFLMPNNKVDGNRSEYIIPQNGKPAFANDAGKTQLLALVVSNVSELTWLENARNDKDFIVMGEHLNSISNSTGQIMESFYMEFLVS